jgi:hypothetical protein
MNRFFISLFLLSTLAADAQYKDSEASQMYTGIGYSLVIFTNPDVSSIYPTIDLYHTGLLSEVYGYLGFKFNKYFAAEFSPSMLFARNTDSPDGFWYSEYNRQVWYISDYASLFSLNVDVKAKIFPFGGEQASLLKDFYLSTGGGVSYLKEEGTYYIYNDNSYNMTYLGTRLCKNDTWTPNLMFSIGVSTPSKISYGFDITYRIVPIPLERSSPLSTANASNYNSLNLSIKVLFNM